MMSVLTLLLFTWTLAGRTPSDCSLEEKDAAVTLRCPAGSRVANATATDSQPAEPLRASRVTISGELRTRDVMESASLWMRIDAGESMLLLNNGAALELDGTRDWTRVAVSLPVPSNATNIAYGVRLDGGGTVEARNLRVESAPLDARKRMSAAARQQLDAAIRIVRTHAMHRDQVDWNAVEPEVRLLAAGARTTGDVYPAIRYMLTKLRDEEGFLLARVPGPAGEMMTNPPLEARALGDGIGYVQVPLYMGSERAAMVAYTVRALDDIAATMPSARCGWILDLRTNGGANMWPIFAALRPFLGDGPIGSFAPSGVPWLANRYVDIAPPAALRALQDAKVAVLTSSSTMGPGEGVAVAFRGRPNTRFFGTPTGGLTNVSEKYPLPDGAAITLTTGIFADRTGRSYGGKLEPDEVVEGREAAIAAATRWLRCSQ